MSKLYNLARMTSATSGTGTITLGSAVSGFLTFALAGVQDGEIVSYGIRDGANSEVGFGTYASAGTTLARTTVLKSTNADAAINLSGNEEVYITALAEDIPQRYICNGRLTLESGVPVSTADQADKTTLYFTPYLGNSITLFDGNVWRYYNFTELSLVVSAFTASKPYDIFIYDNSGTLTLDSLVWTDDTTRATALTKQDGVYVLTGATNKRYIGTIYIDSGQKCQDTLLRRYLWNYNNRVKKQARVSDSANPHAYATATWRSWNNDAAVRIQLIIGVVEEAIPLILWGDLFPGTDGRRAVMSMGYDVTNNYLGVLNSVLEHANAQRFRMGTSATHLPSAGFHFYQIVENAASGASVTFNAAELEGYIFG